MTSKTVKLHLPAAPSVNTLFRNAKAGDNVKHRIKTKAYAQWEAEAMSRIMIQRPPKFDGPVSLHLSHGQLRANADVSNYIKAAEDVLVKMGIIKDDTRRTVLWVSSCYNPDIEGTLVIIEPII